MVRALLILTAATVALAFQPVAACELTRKIVQPTHVTTAALEALPAIVMEEVDLPSIESLTAESDFTVFMQTGVAKDVQTAALRRLWQLNPAFSRTDGLDSDVANWR